MIDVSKLVTSVNGKIGDVTIGLNDLPDVKAAIDLKVDKVDGEGLSHNDFTDTYKELLDTLVQEWPDKTKKFVLSVNNIYADPQGNVAIDLTNLPSW
jgi:hypothetical protein